MGDEFIKAREEEEGVRYRVQPKIINLVVVADAGPAADTAYEIMQRAAGTLQEEGFDHHFWCASHEDGPEPSVWFDKETDTVWTKNGDYEGYFGLRVDVDGPQLKMTSEINEEWEVLA